MVMGGRAFRGGGGPHGRGRDGEPEVEPLKITDRRMLGWFVNNLGPHWYKIALGVSAMVLGTAAEMSVPLVLKSVFDDVIMPGDLEPLSRLVVLLLVFVATGQILGAVRMNVMHLLGQRFVYTLRMQCYHHIMRLGLGYFERQRTGDVMSRVSNDVGAVEDMVVHGTDNVITSVVQIALIIGVMFWLNVSLALVAIAPLPIFIISIVIFARFIRPVFRRIREELGDINVKLQERISGIQVIKAFGREEEEVDYFEESSRAYWRMSAKSIWMWTTFFPAVGLITSAGMVIVIWYGATLATRGVDYGTAGTLVAFMVYLQRFYHPIGALVQVYNTLNRALASMARIFELLDETPDVQDKEDAVELGEVEGRVDIEGVSFKYATGETVLHDVSVSAAPGETVAIVGRSGAGKTTLVNLIPRFYDPYEGRVLVDGHDVRDVTVHSLRRNTGIVLQETFLFNDTVKENIRYARPDATDEEVIAAARSAYAHDFIERLEEGYESVIGERGVKLSGGQKQRIAIARALLADPRILILDEATSLVDTEAEQMIQQALHNLKQGRTTFAIAHRLSTIRNADRIVVIDEGEIVEQDRHDALMARNGLYAEMYNRQFQIDETWRVEGMLGGEMDAGGDRPPTV